MHPLEIQQNYVISCLRGNPSKNKSCVKLGMMPAQTNIEMTAAHMNYRVSKKLIFKWQGRLREGSESLNDDSGPLT